MPHSKSEICLTEEIPPLPFDARLDEETVKRARRIRWQWYLLYNRVRSAPWTHATDTHLARCEEVIAIIDRLLESNPTNH